MTKMDLFEETGSSFEQTYKTFVEELCPAYVSGNYHFYQGMLPYLEELFNDGKLIHSEELDAFVSKLYTTSQEEYDIFFGYYEAQRKCLANGATLAKVVNEKRSILEAVAALYEQVSDVNIEYALQIAKCLDESNAKRFMRYATSKGYLIKESTSLSVYKVYNMLEISKHAKEILTLGLDIFDTYNVAAKCVLLGSTDEALNAAVRHMEFFFGKEYVFEVANLLDSIYSVDGSCLPLGEELWDLMVLNELRDSSLEYSTLVSYYNSVKAYHKKIGIEYSEWCALVNAVYNTGFSITFIKEDSYGGDAAYFCELASLAKRATESYDRYHKWSHTKKLYSRTGIEYYYYNTKQYELLCSSKLLNLFKYVYENMSINQLSGVIEYDPTAMFLNNWLTRLEKSMQCFCAGGIDNVVHKDFSEVQIFSVQGGRTVPVYHLPVDFLVEYQNEIERTIKSLSAKVCSITIKKLMQNKHAVSSLIIVFSDSNNISYEARTNPVDMYSDMTVDKEIVFDNSGRVSMPILKKRLYKMFADAGKDTDVLETLDAQTIMALISALILQDSEEYKQLFEMSNSFLGGFKALKWFIRSDDNFFSAVLRYVLALAGTHSYYSNNQISKNLSENVRIGEQECSLMKIFQKDMTLVSYLKEHNVSLELKGDVIYFA